MTHPDTDFGPVSLLPSKRCRRGATSLLALALLTALPAAQAALDPDPYKNVPLYRALVLGGIDRDGDGGFVDQDVAVIDYANNFAPMPLAQLNRSISANGATMSFNGWSALSGLYATRAYATMNVTNAAATDGYYLVAGQGTTTSVTFFTEQAQSARATFTFRISGSESNPSNIGRSTSRVDFAASTDTSKSWTDLFTGGLTGLSEFGPGTYTYTLPSVSLGTPLNLYFWSSAFTEVKPGEFTQGANFSMTANYGNTFVLEDVQLYDTNDQPLSDWTMEDPLDGIVFDQSGRIAPIMPSPIPEPGTWALMLGGLCVVGRLARQRNMP